MNRFIYSHVTFSMLTFKSLLNVEINLLDGSELY